MPAKQCQTRKSKFRVNTKVFIVQDIITHRTIISKRCSPLVEYLIRWQGYSEKHNTWQTRADFVESDIPDSYDAKFKSEAMLLFEMCKIMRSTWRK